MRLRRCAVTAGLSGRAPAALALAAALAVACVAPRPAGAQAHPAPADSAVGAAVTYRVGGSVYVSAGQEQGLAGGDTLTVRRGGTLIARLVVREAAARRAACDTLSGGSRVQVGDDVAWTAHPGAAGAGVAGSVAAPESASAAASESPPGAGRPAASVVPASAPRRGAQRTRGRIGLSAWTVSGGGSASTVQPAVDARLDARALAPGLDLSLDVRGRGTYRTGGAALTDEEMRARVYRASLQLHSAGGGRSLTLGRQLASPLSSVSLFDGALAELRGARWAGGLLLGTQPEPVRLAPSTDLVEGGAYLEAHARPGASRRWTATVGGVTSSQNGQPNRDFLFAQGYYQDRRSSLWLAQEFDVARGWRQAFQPGRVQLTSTFVSGRLDLARAVALRAGYDGRRDVALYRDRLTPETQFDDALRQGAWVGATLTGGPGLRLDGDLRRRFADVGGGASNAWSSMLEWAGTRALRPRLRVRYARSTSDLVRTSLASLGVECSPGAATHVGLTGGTRRTEDVPSRAVDDAPWWTADFDVALLRAWSLAGSFDHEGASDGAVNQGYLGLAYRF